MSKQIKRPKVAAGFNMETGLPTPETVNAQVNAIIPKDTGKAKQSFTLEQATAPPPERNYSGLTKKGRAKFTTMLRPDLRKRLESIAAQQQVTSADVLETIILEYFGG